MTPKEWKFLCEVVVASTKAGYELRDKEIETGKPVNNQQFKMGRASTLTLQSQLKKFLNKSN